jgi:hypothetical protein
MKDHSLQDAADADLHGDVCVRTEVEVSEVCKQENTTLQCEVRKEALLVFNESQNVRQKVSKFGNTLGAPARCEVAAHTCCVPHTASLSSEMGGGRSCHSKLTKNQHFDVLWWDVFQIPSIGKQKANASGKWF